MQTFNLTERAKPAIEYTPIKVPEDKSDDELSVILTAAEAALLKYKRMLGLIKKADSITDTLVYNDWESELMSQPEYDEVEALEHCATDAIHYLNKHLRVQVMKFTQFCEDIESEIDAIKDHKREIKMYGSHEDQVRRDYFSSVL